MSRNLSTKGLAGRLTAEYSQRRPFRRRLFLVSVVTVLAMGTLWATVARLGPRDAMLQPGGVAAVHRTVARDCTACHDMFRSTPESKCQACHHTPGHNPRIEKVLELTPPACHECHLEHRAGTRAPPPADSRCAECHHNLTRNVKEELLYQDGITGFGAPHPEFAALRTPDQDAAQLKFNHQFHMDKPARDKAIGTMGDQWARLVGKFLKDNAIEREPALRAELACTDCHTSDVSGRLMQPVRYAKHCASCHALEYDLEQRATGASVADTVPHDTPDVIHRHLVAQFTEQRRKLDAAAPDRRPTPAGLRQAAEWVNTRVIGVENGFIASGRCAQCHTTVIQPDSAGGPLGERLTVAPTNVPPRWFKHAQFSHAQHRTMSCEACHYTVRASNQTRHVNLPKIKDCQSCHSPQAGARSDCVECHTYHDEKDRQRNQGKIRELPNRAER